MLTGKRPTLRMMVASGVLASTLIAFPMTAVAAQADSPPASGSTTVISPSCMADVKRIAALTDAGLAEVVDAEKLCSGTVTTTESQPQAATAAEVAQYAEQNHLSSAATDSLISAALDGSVMYRDWTHSYWGGSLLEKHAGRTFWDGSSAWIATNRGLTGANVCHSEGGIAVGWSVTPLECTSPGPSGSADAFYRFDASVAFEGSPVTLDIGLHYATSATGEVSTWQVGG